MQGVWQVLQVATVVAAAWLAGCASTPPTTDGPEASPPPDLERVPDVVPRVEPLRVGGPNRPYELNGVAYVPITADRAFKERGLASWYGRKFHGRPTASGEIYDMYAMSAAHPTLPIPSYVRVRNPANRREVIVRVNDRGPFHRGRIIDLSYTAALKLGVLRGLANVEIERLTHDDIRAGRWRSD
jgi:rare lipoprotein A